MMRREYISYLILCGTAALAIALTLTHAQALLLARVAQMARNW